MDPTHLEAGAIIAIVSAELVEILKSAKWITWISHETQGLNRIVGGVIAFATGLGISTHFDSSAGTLVISGLAVNSVTHAFAQWVQQQVYYRLIIKKSV